MTISTVVFTAGRADLVHRTSCLFCIPGTLDVERPSPASRRDFRDRSTPSYLMDRTRLSFGPWVQSGAADWRKRRPDAGAALARRAGIGGCTRVGCRARGGAGHEEGFHRTDRIGRHDCGGGWGGGAHRGGSGGQGGGSRRRRVHLPHGGPRRRHDRPLRGTDGEEGVRGRTTCALFPICTAGLALDPSSLSDPGGHRRKSTGRGWARGSSSLALCRPRGGGMSMAHRALVVLGFESRARRSRPALLFATEGPLRVGLRPGRPPPFLDRSPGRTLLASCVACIASCGFGSSGTIGRFPFPTFHARFVVLLPTMDGNVPSIDVLGDPFEPFAVSHAPDDAAHEDFDGTHPAGFELHLPFPGGEVVQSQAVPQFVFGRCGGHVDLVSQHQEGHLGQGFVAEQPVQFFPGFWEPLSIRRIHQIEGFEVDPSHLQLFAGGILGGLVLGQSLVFQHVHQRGLPCVVQSLFLGGKVSSGIRPDRRSSRRSFRQIPFSAARAHARLLSLSLFLSFFRSVSSLASVVASALRFRLGVSTRSLLPLFLFIFSFLSIHAPGRGSWRSCSTVRVR
eukprot:scaffold738_cov340-Pavlova_lutheri.AAC.11